MGMGASGSQSTGGKGGAQPTNNQVYYDSGKNSYYTQNSMGGKGSGGPGVFGQVMGSQFNNLPGMSGKGGDGRTYINMPQQNNNPMSSYMAPQFQQQQNPYMNYYAQQQQQRNPYAQTQFGQMPGQNPYQPQNYYQGPFQQGGMGGKGGMGPMDPRLNGTDAGRYAQPGMGGKGKGGGMSGPPEANPYNSGAPIGGGIQQLPSYAQPYMQSMLQAPQGWQQRQQEQQANRQQGQQISMSALQNMLRGMPR